MNSLRRLTLHNRQRRRQVDLRFLRRIAESLLDAMTDSGGYELGIFLVAAPKMTRLNEQFLHHAGSTDVITFDYAGPTGFPAGGAGEAEPLLYGDIFICVDEALIQARRFRVTWQSELVRYLVHGILHLRGLDDLEPKARRRMKREEDRWVAQAARQFNLSRLAGTTASPRRHPKS